MDWTLTPTITGHLNGYAVWLGDTRIATFRTLTNAARAASALRSLLEARQCRAA